MLVLVSVEIGMALLARSAPMLNLNSAGAPVRLIVGLLVLTVMVPAVASVVAGVGQLGSQVGCADGRRVSLRAVIPSMADQSDKTEKPTPKKLKETKEEGRTPRSRDVTVAVTSLTATAMLVGFGSDRWSTAWPRRCRRP